MLKKSLNVIFLALGLSIFTSCVFYTSGSYVRDQVYNDDAYLVVIPGTYVYYYDGQDDDIYFYGGYWWKPWQNGWYRGSHYSGPWVVVKIVQVPQAVVRLPNGWKMTIHRDDRIPYEEVRDNSRKWERDRYWEKREWKRDDGRDFGDRRQDRDIRSDEPRKMDVRARIDDSDNNADIKTEERDRNGDVRDKDRKDNDERKDKEKKKRKDD